MIERFFDWLEALFKGEPDEDLKQAEMRLSVCHDNKVGMRENLYARSNAPEPDRLRPRADIIILR